MIMEKYKPLFKKYAEEYYNAREGFWKVLELYNLSPRVPEFRQKIGKEICVIETSRNSSQIVIPQQGGCSIISKTAWAYCFNTSILNEQPAKILALVNLIRRATDWFQNATAGMERHYEEICRQQQKAIEHLDAELTLTTLEE